MAKSNDGKRSGRSGYRKITDARNGVSGNAPVTCDLTREQKAACKTDFEQTGLDLDELSAAIDAGYKLSVTGAGRPGTFVATLTDKAGDSEFEGRWLSIRASNPVEAVFRVLWVTSTLCNGDWAVLEQLSHEIGEDW